MPIPALPKPTMAIFCCSRGTPVMLIAEINVAVAIGGRALNVVVEGAQLVAVTGQKASSIGAGKVLPLEKDLRPASFYAAYKEIDKCVISFAANPVMPPPDIKRALQPCLRCRFLHRAE